MTLTKRVFFASILIFSISLLLWGVYNFSFKKTPVDPAPVEKPKEKPQKEISPISPVSDEAVVSPFFSNDTRTIRYYSKTTGRAYEMDLDGQNKRVISGQDFSGIQEASWSTDGKKAILKLVNSDGKTRFMLYDFIEKKASSTKENADEIVWQPQNGKVIYKYFDPKTNERTLNVSDSDGQNWRKLADLAYKKVSIAAIPQSGLVSFWNYPDAFDQTAFESVPLIEGERKMIFQDKFGADYLWDHAGDKVLLSHSDQKGGKKMQTAIINYNGGEYKNLGIPTFTSKMAWSKNDKLIYYAFPSGLPDTAVLPNEYQEGKFETTDTFWKIDTSTGQSSRLVETEKIDLKIDADNLFLNSDESLLFFRNKVDGKIYRLNL